MRALDKITFSQWFEGKGGSRGSIERMWDPIAYALGFIDCDHISARCMLTIFQASCGWGGGVWGTAMIFRPVVHRICVFGGVGTFGAVGTCR